MFSCIYHTLYSPLLSEDASAYEHLILLYIIYIYSNGKDISPVCSVLLPTITMAVCGIGRSQ